MNRITVEKEFHRVRALRARVSDDLLKAISEDAPAHVLDAIQDELDELHGRVRWCLAWLMTNCSDVPDELP
jgi:hypothetical protein